MGRARITGWDGKPVKRISKREQRREAELRQLERAGAIQGLQTQVRIHLEGRDGPILTPTGRRAVYVADFVYSERGARIVEDSKGHHTEVYLLKRAILAAMGISVRET